MIFLHRLSDPEVIVQVDTQEEADLLLHPLQVEDEPYVVVEGVTGTPPVVTLTPDEVAGEANAEEIRAVDEVASEAPAYVPPAPVVEATEAPEVPADTVQGPDIDTTPANELV